jgi:hypothetical protein
VRAALQAAAGQVSADLTLRLRAPATLVAALAILGAASFWMPHTGQVSSVSWKTAEGVLQAPVFNIRYAGAVAGILGGIFSMLVAFYLVAGSVRRDRATGVGTLIAASPVSSSAYLGARFVGNFVYLGLMAGLIAAAALARFLWFGHGPFSLSAFLAPFLVLNVPALAFVAAAAVFFDVTPLLRTRAAPVLWFFTMVLLLMAIPAHLAESNRTDLPAFDPLGPATFSALVERSFAGAGARDISTGLVFHSKPLQRVPWSGLPIGSDLVGARALSLLWCVPILVTARLFFDRFDHARARPGRRGPAQKADAPAAHGGSAQRYADLGAVHAVPSWLHSTLAEARLVWQGASLLRWPLLGTAMLTVVKPANVAGPAAFLLLLGIVVAEASARDAQSGITALLAAQPGVPRFPALWKAAAVVVFCLTVGALPLAAAFLRSPVHGAALALGILFLATFASAAGSLTAGGRLFLGFYLMIWYGAVSGAPGLDFAGAFVTPSVTLSAAYAAAALMLLGVAVAVERRRA